MEVTQPINAYIYHKLITSDTAIAATVKSGMATAMVSAKAQL